MDTIKNPIEFTGKQVAQATSWLGGVARAARGQAGDRAEPRVRQLELADIRTALAKGWEDLGAIRSDVVALCLTYPVVGLVISILAYDLARLPLVFPLAAGFALVGPFFAVAVYELSRRRAAGEPAHWGDALAAIASPAFGAVFLLGLGLIALFVAWLLVAQVIYDLTLGPEQPLSAIAFLEDAVATPAGWVMMGAGFGIGFLFALAALAGAAFSFPMLMHRDVGIRTAVTASLRVFRQNTAVMLGWGLTVATLLLFASIPAFVGLVFVMPLLGHATWHLYRRAIAWPDETA
ncbi:MAG: DUF2189 domain-containing protein [Pseudomonadota bacterium]